MGILDWFRNRGKPITVHDWRNFHGGQPDFNQSNIKACTTEEPRYVLTDESRDRYVVYTESLITCIGVLIHGESNRGDVAALVHTLAGRPSEAKKVGKVVEEMNQDYRIGKLEAVLVIGDEPDEQLFDRIVEVLKRFNNIKSFNVIYGGEGEPGFENGFRDSYECASKVAYDTRHHGLLVGADRTQK